MGKMIRHFSIFPSPVFPRTGGSGPVTLELCAGAGGQALGFEQGGILHAGLVEIDPHACATLHLNRPKWNILRQDLQNFDGDPFKGVDIISGGLPCPPFSVAGKQLGIHDERNLFPDLLRLTGQIRPRVVMVENVRGILEASFEPYRHFIACELKKLGYTTGWRLMNASDFGVPQLRPRAIMVAIKHEFSERFSWPQPIGTSPKPVGDVLSDLMVSNGWLGAEEWKKQAGSIAPTIVGGSKKHGGPDLGPTRAKKAWAALQVDGHGIADQPPAAHFTGMPRLTARMVARLQGFPDDWQFAGSKTAVYRQVGNAFPPPFARAMAEKIKECFGNTRIVSAAG